MKEFQVPSSKIQVKTMEVLFSAFTWNLEPGTWNSNTQGF